MKYWVVSLGRKTDSKSPFVCLNNKGIAREITRSFGWGVFWEIDGDKERPIMVGHASPGIKAAGTYIEYPPFVVKEHDILYAAELKRHVAPLGFDAMVACLKQNGLIATPDMPPSFAN